MATQAELIAQISALKKARASGLRRVRFGEREMEYRTDKDLKAAIDDLEDELGDLEGKPRRSRYRYFTTSKDL